MREDVARIQANWWNTVAWVSFIAWCAVVFFDLPWWGELPPFCGFVLGVGLSNLHRGRAQALRFVAGRLEKALMDEFRSGRLAIIKKRS